MIRMNMSIGKKYWIFLIFCFSINLSFANSNVSLSKNILAKSMSRSLESFLSLTNYLERHRYIFRHDAREILDVFNSTEIVDVERINEFGATIDSLREEINNNVRVKRDVKERVDIQVNEILGSIQLALQKREALLNSDIIAQKFATAERKLSAAESTRNAAPKVIIKTQKTNQTLPFALSGILLFLVGIFIFGRRSQKKELADLKRKLSLSVKKRKSVEKKRSLTSSFSEVVRTMDSPMSLVVDLKGNVLSSSKSFSKYFDKYLAGGEINWDNFFENNFFQSKEEKEEVGTYRFRKDSFSRFFITSQLVESEGIRFLTFRFVDTEKMIKLTNQTTESLENGVSSANEIYEMALTECSKLYKLSNVELVHGELEAEIKTYSNKEQLKNMFYKSLVFINTLQKEFIIAEKVKVDLSRVEGVLILSIRVNNIDFNLDMNEKVKDTIRELSQFVSSFEGEFIVKKERARDINQIVFELRVYDLEVAFENRITTLVENEKIN